MARKKFQWSRDDDDPEGKGEFHFTPRSSWSEQDRSNKRVVALAKALVKLKPSAYAEIVLSEEVRVAVDEAKRLKAKGNVKGGMRRQMLMVGTVLRAEDEEVLDQIFEDVERLIPLNR
jgi:ribosomal 50S subunit-associated protein YjgA (DUF615 family)